MTSGISGLAVLALLGSAALPGLSGAAQAATTATAPVSPAASAAAPKMQAPAPVAESGVTGFRSARFGDDEASVRAAIIKDFGVPADAIKASDNLGQQTHVLTVRVPDVLASGGTADVAYVLGYRSKTLIQVGVVWSKASDSAMTPERLFANGNILRTHFTESGVYTPDSIATDVAAKGGLLMFRGSDADGHTTILLLQGGLTAPAGTSEADKTKRVLTPTSLDLIYLQDAKNPDVFRIPPGQF